MSAPPRDRTTATKDVDRKTLRRVIVAASVGTLFEWYDFYLYGSLAIFFGAFFFPPGNETAQLLASLATFGAGFGVRPLGAIVFGHRDVDHFDFVATLLGTAVHVYGSQNRSATDETRCTGAILQVACGDGDRSARPGRPSP